MRTLRPMSRSRLSVILLAATAGLAHGAWVAAPADEVAAPGAMSPAPKRRSVDGEPTKLGFKNATVEQIVPFIVETTGKVVMPQRDVMSRQITVLSDKALDRGLALDLLFEALQQNGVGVIETENTIALRDLGEIIKGPVPVIGPTESLAERTDAGTILWKVYPLRHSSAKNIGDIIKDSLPDFAKYAVDEESNQVTVLGNVGLLQRLELLIRSLDRPAIGAVVAETFRLRYADAEAIKTNIEELFSASAASGARQGGTNRGGQGNQGGGNRGGQNNQGGPVFRFPGFGGQGAGQEASTASTSELRVSANAQQNSVTVVADPAVLEQIRRQIDTYWDIPPGPNVTPRTFELQYTDAIKVRDLLTEIFGRGSTTRTGQQGGQGNQNQAASAQSVGPLAGQFTFQAIPESNRLVAITKTPENMAFVERMIESIDTPQTAGLPAIVELKHASSEDLAEQINALLAQDGTLAQIRRSESGLSSSQTAVSPFAQEQAANQAQEQVQPDMIGFWWQRSRPPTDKRTASNLVGQLRIVPVWRQNALMVVAPPEYRASIVELISRLDRPGKQVLLSAIVAEVSRDDATALGLRWSSQTITPTNGDNSIGLSTSAEGQRNDFAEALFNTSVLNANVDLNLLLQALSQKTNVSILSEPKIFTSDNQEATFFDGQDIPFVNELQSTNVGNPIQSFDYRAVGLQLRIRPRITPQRDVDLRVNLQLASIAPGQTVSNALIVDRRETTTQLILKDRQTIVISGILRSEDSNIVRKIPLLGDIPILGELFKSREVSRSNTDLLVFITPVVIENPEEADAVNEGFRRRLEERRRDLEHDKTDSSLVPGGPGDPALNPPPAVPGSPDQRPTPAPEPHR